MDETTIARFLAGEATAAELDGDGEPLTKDFDVDTEMILRFVDAGERGELSPEALKTAADVMLESDRFVWVDDNEIGVLYDWSSSSVDLAEARQWLSVGPVRYPFELRPYREVMLICAGVCILAEAIVFIGNAVIGPAFADGNVGNSLFIFGFVFFPVIFLLILLQAYLNTRP